MHYSEYMKAITERNAEQREQLERPRDQTTLQRALKTIGIGLAFALLLAAVSVGVFVWVQQLAL